MPLFPILAAAAFVAMPLTAIPAPRAAEATTAAACLPPETLRGATVVALSVYSSRGPTMPFMLAGSRYPVHALPVTSRAKTPIVLVVAAYEPVLWDLSAMKGRVRAVVASGYYPQAVTGLAPDTPVRFSSSVGNFRGSETCARIRYAYRETTEIQALADDIRAAIGVGPRQFFGDYSADSLDVDATGAADPGAFQLSDVRSSVPLITEDDPASTAQMKSFPSAAAFAAERPKRRIVEWNERGAIVRDEGGPARAVPTSGFREAMPDRPARAGSSAATFFARLLLLGMVVFVIWLIGRSRATARNRPRPAIDPRRAAPPPQVAPAVAVQALAFDRHVTELASLAAITDSEPLVVALHRYGRELRSVARTTFDADLREEVEAIVKQHLAHAVARYRQVRPSLEGMEAERADTALTHAVERLAVRLHELHAAQHHRDVSGVDAAARFIDYRHPA